MCSYLIYRFGITYSTDSSCFSELNQIRLYNDLLGCFWRKCLTLLPNTADSQVWALRGQIEHLDYRAACAVSAH